jgi:outer membrane protein OmpA-like peptidoglycan-associated protein
MKKDNDNEERLIETIVTIGTLIFFGFLSMYAMRGCSNDVSYSGEQTATPAVVAAAGATTAAATDLDKDGSLTDTVALTADVNETLDKDVNVTVEDVEDMNVDENESDDSEADMDANTTAASSENIDTNESVDTVNESDDNRSENANSVNTANATAVADKGTSEANEEAGIIADINSNSASAKPYVLKGIYFRSGSSILTKKSKRQLDAIAKALKAHKDVKITLRGHTDSKGSKKENQTLSMKRASSVGLAFVDRGVNIDNIWIDGMGESEPITQNGTAKEMLRNRRVDIAVTK